MTPPLSRSTRLRDGAWMAPAAALFIAARGAVSDAAAAERPIVIGLNADMSRSTTVAGRAIQRGALLAIGEINASGGVLKRPLELKTMDHRGVPARGRDNPAVLADTPDVIAALSGLHPPVALAEPPLIHQKRIPYLVPWAAGTPVVENGYDPNFVFRVSVRDDLAAGFLLSKALERGATAPCLLAENTGWGRSNEAGFAPASTKAGVVMARIQFFNRGAPHMTPRLKALRAHGRDLIFLIANATEGGALTQSMARLAPADRPPVMSHWGVAGGGFGADHARELSQIDFSVLQTYSFSSDATPKTAKAVIEAYGRRFNHGTVDPRARRAPTGVAHAYDPVPLLAMAIEHAGRADREAVRAALETLGRYEGLARVYDPAFTPKRHDALDANHFRLARFNAQGDIIPIDAATTFFSG